MTTLKANESARAALAWRKLHERAELVRGRVEAMPGAHMDGSMRAAENRIALRQMDKAVETLDRIDEELDAYRQKIEKAEVANAATEQDALLAAKGIETARTASGVGQRHGLLWLIDKGRLTGTRKRAGQAWSTDYALIRTDSLRSCLNDNAPGGAANDDESARYATRITDARNRLERARHHIIHSTGSARLADLLDAVCGRGETLRSLCANDKDKADRMEVELGLALDMVAVSYEIVRAAA